MIGKKPAMTLATGITGAMLMALAGPAIASVKDGVDAWAKGDYAKAVAEWRDPAANGDPDAMFNLAQAYRLGRGVPVDTKQAEMLYSQAAARGHLKAADNYGLLLFQDGQREKAMPYITAAAERGDPRAQYLLGIAHFNGDLAAKDWVRAYALLTLANGSGLPQAGPAIRKMDEFIPLAQRQQAQSLVATMRNEADATRAAQMASADLGEDTPTASGAIAGTAARVPRPVAPVAIPPSVGAADLAVAESARASVTGNPKTAGADFARPPATRTEIPASATVKSANSALAKTSSGPWKLQLGAFSVASNVDRAWSQVADSAMLAGKSKEVARTGRLTRLLAAGWPDRSSAETACAGLKAGGHTCLVTR